MHKPESFHAFIYFKINFYNKKKHAQIEILPRRFLPFFNFDFSLQYSEIKWFSIEELQDLNIFEGEEGIKEAFKNLIKNN